MNNNSNNNNNNTMDIPSSDILRLLHSHLSECGLHATSSTLRLESGGVICMPGLFPSTKGSLIRSASDGRWGEALRLLDGLDLARVKRGCLEDYNKSLNNKEEGNDNANNGVGEESSSSIVLITPLERAVAMTHEMAILELAEKNEVELAYATLRMCSEMLDRILKVNYDNGHGNGGDGEDNDVIIVNNNNNSMKSNTNHNDNDNVGMMSSRSGDVERRITALSSMRRSASTTSDNINDSTSLLLPANYYGLTNPSKQKRRDQIAKLLKRHVPEVPLKRLPALLQQSIKWQCHTGTFPTVQRLFQQKEEGEKEGGEEEDDEEAGDGKKKKKKKRKKNANNLVQKKFDLVLGNVDVTFGDGKKKRKKDDQPRHSAGNKERIPSRPHQTIRLGKKSYIESACFLPDGRGLVTGSSDGFIEVWGEPTSRSTNPSTTDSLSDNEKDSAASKDASKNDLDSLLSTADIDYEKLRTSDLSYQKKDDLMMHDSAVLAMNVSHDGTLLGTTSSDGTVCVWKIADGKLLRKVERAHGGIGGVSDKGAAVTCIQFSPDGSKILTGGHDSTCREFGLLASRMLKEFRGHKSYVNCCRYVVLPHSVAMGGGGAGGNDNFLAVVTASADGSVRVWNGRTAEPVREITPPIPTTANAVIHDKDSIVGSKSIHTVMHLHSPANTMIVVPRTDRAYLMSYSGAVLRTYARDDVQGSEFLAATVSASNQWLYVAADDGKCVVFDVNTGKVEKIIRSFAEECSSGRSETKACEISGLVCHPNRGFVGGYSNDKGQKRGILTLWK